MREGTFHFIKQTAKDYALPFWRVKQLYIWYWGSGEFYSKLEQEITNERRTAQTITSRN